MTNTYRIIQLKKGESIPKCGSTKHRTYGPVTILEVVEPNTTQHIVFDYDPKATVESLRVQLLYKGVRHG